jgi:hypothetical protein
MTRRDLKTEREIREAIIDYIETNGADSTRTIADYVESQLGKRPANDTVSSILKELGYVVQASYWVKA